MKTPYLILLVIGAAGFFVAVGWLVWSVYRPYGAIKTWPEIAPRLGLTYTPFPVSTAMQPGSMAGIYAGSAVSIAAQNRFRRGTVMTVEVRFRHSLGCGLCIGSSGELREQAEGALVEFSTADQDFDKVFRPRAREIGMARGMFEDNSVRGALLDLVKWDRNVGVDDEKLVYLAEDMVSDFAVMKELLDRVVQAARSIEEARR